ncbi:Long-chain-fatty-acid--CoA ligase [Mycobacterium marinum MB2]|nr:Long-chain-fatty-acid--CoA ligase [Mycobacterium marinum MB2]
MQRLRGFGREWRAATADEAQCGASPAGRVGFPFRLGALQQDLVDRGHRGVPGGVRDVNVVPECVRREFSASRQQHRAPRDQGRQQRGHQAVAVVQRHHRNRRVLWAQPVSRDDGPYRGGDVGARPGNHLRQPRGSPGEHDHGVVGPQPLGRRRHRGGLGGSVQMDRQDAGIARHTHRDRPPSNRRFIPVAGSGAVDEHHACPCGPGAGALVSDRQRRIQRNDDQIRA